MMPQQALLPRGRYWTLRRAPNIANIRIKRRRDAGFSPSSVLSPQGGATAPGPGWARPLGWFGLVPFWGLALAAWFGPAALQGFALMALLAYGATILSFLGGLFLGFAWLTCRSDHRMPGMPGCSASAFCRNCSAGVPCCSAVDGPSWQWPPACLPCC